MSSGVYEIAEVIARTFERYFDNPERPENFIELARKIHRALNEK